MTWWYPRLLHDTHQCFILQPHHPTMYHIIIAYFTIPIVSQNTLSHSFKKVVVFCERPSTNLPHVTPHRTFNQGKVLNKFLVENLGISFVDARYRHLKKADHVSAAREQFDKINGPFKWLKHRNLICIGSMFPLLKYTSRQKQPYYGPRTCPSQKVDVCTIEQKKWSFFIGCNWTSH